MTYFKMTTISGHTSGYVKPTAPVGSAERLTQVAATEGKRKCWVLNGHWRPESALNYARKRGCVGQVEITHSTADMSGKGYGGYDRVYLADDADITERPLTAAEREYSDGDDINDVYDTAQA